MREGQVRHLKESQVEGPEAEEELTIAMKAA